MLLQGDLQKVFDALYHMGVIDPVLEMDWSHEFEAIEKNPYPLAKIVNVVNSSRGGKEDLMEQLKEFDAKDLGHLAMIVAKELVGFHSNKVLH
ncbi:MAG: cytochrome [Bdellovibrionales bacterium]|nr:cytochrome [Bdellovibrionales bacterium]